MKLTRRDLAKSLGLVGASYFLPNLRPAYAASGIARRFIIFYTQHGTLPWRWRPKGTGTDFQLGPMHTNLESYKKDLILLDGVDFGGLFKDYQFSCGHARGQAGSLTANKFMGGAKGNSLSIDHFIANGLKAANGGVNPTAVALQQARIMNRFPNVPSWGAPFHAAPGQPAAGEPRSSAILNRLFPDGKVPGTTAPSMPGQPTGPDKATQKRSAALDFLKNEFKVVEQKLGKAERERLEMHATLVSDLKNSIDKSGAGGAGGIPKGGPTASCAVPQGLNTGGGWAASVDAMPKLAVAALACDVTRVFALQLEDPPGGHYNFNDNGDAIHNRLHDLDNNKKDNQSADLLSTANSFYGAFGKEFKSLLDKLSAVKEADGNSLLYHTCVLWCGELADSSHTSNNAKWMTAGQLGGFLKTGQVIAPQGPNLDEVVFNRDAVVMPSNGDVFTTIAEGMGVANPEFGVNNLYKGGIAAMKSGKA